MNLVLHAGRVDHQAGVVPNHHAADEHLAGAAVDLHIGHPRGPRGAEAGELAVHVAAVGEALTFQHINIGNLLLRPGVGDPAGAFCRRLDQFTAAHILQMAQPKGDRVDLGGGRQLVDIRLMRERVRQR